MSLIKLETAPAHWVHYQVKKRMCTDNEGRDSEALHHTGPAGSTAEETKGTKDRPVVVVQPKRDIDGVSKISSPDDRGPAVRSH